VLINPKEFQMAKKTNGGDLVPQEQPATAVALPDSLMSSLAAYAQETQKTETVKGVFFATRAGQLSFNKQPIPNNEMEVVILRSMFENVYYPEKFNPEQMQSPLCFAYSFTGEGMAPHPDATQMQADTCGNCKYSKWTLDLVDKKNRKPCKEQRRLACMPASGIKDANTVKDANVGYLRIPVTSVKFWAEYAQKLAAGGLPPFAVVTKIKLVPDPKNQVRYEFTAVHRIDNAAVLDALIARHEAEAPSMTVPYERRPDPDAPQPASNGTQPAAPAPGKF